MPESGSSLERLDPRIDTALVTRRLVAMDQAAAGVAIQNRLGDLVSSFCSSHVLRFDGLENLLDGGTQHRARTGVAAAADLCLLGALLGGLDVGHGVAPELMRVTIGRAPCRERVCQYG